MDWKKGQEEQRDDPKVQITTEMGGNVIVPGRQSAAI